MRDTDELLWLIRDSKRHKSDGLSISVKLDPNNLGKPYEVNASEEIKVEPVHFTMDTDTVVAQVKYAAYLMSLEQRIRNMRVKYFNSIGSVYGKLMQKYCDDYADAFCQKDPQIFTMKSLMVNITTLAKELAAREDKDEAIFDAKRINNELRMMEDGIDGDDD